jgi:small subunit ribosomal protein S16
MLRIRLSRVGKKKQPNYRIIVADSRAPRDGRYIERVGFYNPLTNPPTIELNLDRAKHWLSVGAQPSDPVVLMLKKQGLLGGEHWLEESDDARPS